MLKETTNYRKGSCAGYLFLFLFFAGSLFPFYAANSQSTRFQSYTISDGLCHPFVYNINQDKNGFIWIGTGEGLCRYDGLEFLSSSVFDSLPIDVVNVSYVNSLGILWFGFNNGDVWSYDGNHFTSYSIGNNISTAITGFTQSPDDGLIIATQNKGLFTINQKREVVQFSPACTEMLISAIHFDKKLLVGSQNGLIIYDPSDIEGIEPVIVEELNYIKVQVIKNARFPDTYWIGTEDAGLYLLDLSADSITLTHIGVERGLGFENIQDLQYDADSNLWVCTFTSGLLKLQPDRMESKLVTINKFDETSNLTTRFLKCAFLDREGNSWFGTYGEGFLLQTNQAFGFYTYSNSPLGNNILSLAVHDSIIWLGGEKGILQINKRTNQNIYLNSSTGLPNDRITALYYRENELYAGTSTSGIYKYNLRTQRATLFFKSDNSISNTINYLTGDNDNIYAATKNGIFSIDRHTRIHIQYNTLNGLPHNDIEQIFLDNENRLLFATRTNGVYEINVKGEVEEYFTVGKYELDFNSIAQDVNGHIWVSSYGQGVFLLVNDSVINITARDGLKSNYCYSIISADSLYMWVGHRLGISRIELNTLSITVFDSDNGITGDCNANATALSPDRQLYFGTSEGLITYNIEEGYRHRVEPKTNILRVNISDKDYDFRRPIVLPYSAYKLRIDYIGLNYADPKSVRYRYKLEGYDLDYSDLTEDRSIIYPRIEDGEYTFKLQAYGTDGISTSEPVTIQLRVKLPVWKTWWFITSVLVILILSMITIVKYRERKQKQIQEYLELRLDERTREVVEQKEEIEVKNRDITDSINYAQRIQASILPPIKRLQQNFSGSFIFYQPRDIVSGDFYWFDRIDDNKFVIVCADSTGHGVPGAFMSMIGTTLIKDICMRNDVNSPSEILRELDFELRSTLNQNVDAEQSNDGMDIIVCEIDVKTNYLRYASAMRPMIVYRNGEQVYVKGSRSSVGGQYDKEDKIFKDEGVQLDKGDLIYMFSDGYPDQFGGPVGKKFKMVRLKNLLRDIYQKPMEEQYEYVKSTFNLWKEDFDQVDDVLFMGIKI
jgi:ligand-binding sensor domain-containing protein/serine phosphatase RsbU (regulator of sigma subunit)